jgi:photosystem II stability/assembly factor-like uncharacterized protein
VKRLQRLALFLLVAVATLAPAAAVVGLAIYSNYTERATRNADDARFKCYGCVFELTMVSADEGWAAGQGARILHYQDGKLRWEGGADDYAFPKIVASSSDNVWALGGTFQRYQGKNWTKSADSPSTFNNINQVALVSPKDIWAVGENSDDGLIWHYDGVHWRQIQTIIGLSLQGVSMISADDGWAVGTQYAGGKPQTSAFLRYQNGFWSEVASPQGLLYSLAMISPTDGWASGRTVSGEEILYHYDGAAWRAMDPVPCVHITRITMLSASAGWARGYDYSGSDDESALYRFADGVWTRVSIPRDVSLYDLSSLTPGDAWLVGATRTKDQDGYVEGVLLHYLDGNWQTVAIPRQPVTSPDAIPLRYAFENMVGAYVLVLSALLILFARRRAWLPISNEKVRQVFIAWFVLLLGFFGMLIAASYLAAEALEAVPWYFVVGVLALLISFPAAYLAWPLFYRGAPTGAGAEV